MSDKPVHFPPADRISSFKPYFFATLEKQITTLRSQGKDIIRIDIGSPDLPPPDSIIDVLTETARKTNTHGYTPYGGTVDLHQAISTYYQNRFGVNLIPGKETLALIGSKEGLFALSQVLLNPGDISLVPDPSYPVYRAGAIVAGAEVYPMPLLARNRFLPDLNAIPSEIVSRAKVLWLNYPNMPTGAIAPFEFLEEAVQFAQKHHILIAHDAPYVDICFGQYRAPSILQVPGAKEVAIEFNSLSKTYNMAGWRLGMVVGNPDVIGYMHTYKSQMDSSHFLAIIKAGIFALTGDQSWIEERNQIYEHRRDLVLAGLHQVGLNVPPPPAALYVWSPIPEPFTDSMTFCSRLLTEAGVSVTPGVVFGDYGEGYFRISLVTATNKMKEAIDRMVTWIQIVRGEGSHA
ncbi:MAG TPA: aminotransferase class I/II-fold pyridoxal phosphate-dependent enzyme [Anaerolineaceae bacterium]